MTTYEIKYKGSVIVKGGKYVPCVMTAYEKAQNKDDAIQKFQQCTDYNFSVVSCEVSTKFKFR